MIVMVDSTRSITHAERLAVADSNRLFANPNSDEHTRLNSIPAPLAGMTTIRAILDRDRRKTVRSQSFQRSVPTRVMNRFTCVDPRSSQHIDSR
jgi:hypothetical protein